MIASGGRLKTRASGMRNAKKGKSYEMRANYELIELSRRPDADPATHESATRLVEFAMFSVLPCRMRNDPQSTDRPAERKKVQMAVTLVIEGEEAEYLATTVDLSPYGVRLQSHAELAPGEPVGLLLSTEPACFIRARVAWVGKADSAQAGQAGFQFLNPLPGRLC